MWMKAEMTTLLRVTTSHCSAAGQSSFSVQHTHIRKKRWNAPSAYNQREYIKKEFFLTITMTQNFLFPNKNSHSDTNSVQTKRHLMFLQIWEDNAWHDLLLHFIFVYKVYENESKYIFKKLTNNKGTSAGLKDVQTVY